MIFSPLGAFPADRSGKSVWRTTVLAMKKVRANGNDAKARFGKDCD